MANYGQTVKHALRKMLGTSSVREIDDGFAALADDLDGIIAVDDQGLLAARPVSTVGSPGVKGRYYYATDTDQLFRDYGTGWKLVVVDSDARLSNTRVPADGSITLPKMAPQQAWQQLLGGTSGFGGFPPIYYMKDHVGVVHFQGNGIVTNQNEPDNTLWGFLPPGYRPYGDTFYVLGVQKIGSPATVALLTIAGGSDGAVRLRSGGTAFGNTTTITFSAVVFPAYF